MKKAALILLLAIYSLSIFGVTLKKFYCCGRLQSVKFSVAQGTDQKGSDDGCCKTKYQSFKVKESHIGSPGVLAPRVDCIDLFTVVAFYKIDPIAPENDGVICTHDPPLAASNPAYLLNRVFRI